MILVNLDKSGRNIVASLENEENHNVFLIDHERNYKDYIQSDKLYCIVFFCGWYGNHVRFINDILKQLAPKFITINFGFKLIQSEDTLNREIGDLYRGSIGNIIVLIFMCGVLVEYSEQNISLEDLRAKLLRCRS